MNVQQAIQASANVIRITSVSTGDVYKRFDDTYDDRVYFGVVQGVHNDGSTAIIEALEYCYRYSSLAVELKVLRGDKDYKLFPSTPDELNVELGDVLVAKAKDVQVKHDEIAKLEKEIEEIKRLMSGDRIKELQGMSYAEMTQDKFDRTRAAIAQASKELHDDRIDLTDIQF